MNRLCRTLVKTSVLPVLLLAASTPALAQVTFEGNTSVYFDGNTSKTTVGGLSFQGATFGAFDLVNPGDYQNVFFGSFLLNRSVPYNFGGSHTTFDLLVNFILPGAGGGEFDGRITGNINKPGNGTLTFHDFVGSQILTINGAVFKLETFAIGDIKKDDTSAAVNGRITLLQAPPTSTVPEPFSMALLGTGLAGIGAARRRKRTESV